MEHSPVKSRPPWWRATRGADGVLRTPAGILGTIVCGAVIAGGADAGSVPGLALTTLVTLFIYWSADRWAELLSAQLSGHRFSRQRIWRVCVDGWGIVEASYNPLLVMIIFWLLGAGRSAAINAALAVTVLTLGWLGAVAARRGGLAGWGLVGATAFSGCLGLLIVVLKMALHSHA